MKTITKILAVLLVLPVVLILMLVAINISDEELRPEVKRSLNWQVPTDAFKDNGYLILLGIKAPIEQDAYQAGKIILESELTRYQVMQQTHKDSSTILRLDTSPSMNWKEYQCKYQETQNCVNFYEKEYAGKLILKVPSQKHLTNRFYAIKNSKHYVEVMPPMASAEIPYFSSFMYASELERIQAIKDIAEGKIDIGMARFIENAIFSRHFLENANYLISHMVAIAMIERDMRILSELLEKYPQVAMQYKNRLSLILKPIATPEYSFKKPYTYERNVMLSLMNNLKYEAVHELATDKSALQRKITELFYQPDATLNLFYDWGTLRMMLAELDAQHLDENKAKVQEKQKALLGFGFAPYYAKNPVGKILAQVAEPDYVSYIERHHDADGYITLVRLQLKLISERIPKDKVAQLLPNYLNPYTNQKMYLDNKSNIVIFNGRQPSNVNFNRSNIYKISLQ